MALLFCWCDTGGLPGIPALFAYTTSCRSILIPPFLCLLVSAVGVLSPRVPSLTQTSKRSDRFTGPPICPRQQGVPDAQMPPGVNTSSGYQ